MKFRCVKALILDWAGTAIDFGSLAPVAALEGAFESSGVPITAAEAREHMGVLYWARISDCLGRKSAKMRSTSRSEGGWP